MLANKTAYNIFLAKSQNENTKNIEEILKLGAWTTNVQAIAKMCVVSSATISVASTSMGASSSMEATATPVSAMNNAKILAIPPPLYPVRKIYIYIFLQKI